MNEEDVVIDITSEEVLEEEQEEAVQVKGNNNPDRRTQVRLVGKTYVVKHVKAHLVIKVTKQITDGDDTLFNEWIDYLFGDKAEELQKRLNSFDDPLDTNHILLLMARLVEAQQKVNPIM